MPTYPLDWSGACADDSLMFVRCKRRFKGRQGAPLLERGEERPGPWRPRCPAPCSLSRRDQRTASARRGAARSRFVEGKSGSRQMALLPEDREAPGVGLRGGQDQRRGRGPARPAPVGGVLAGPGPVGSA